MAEERPQPRALDELLKDNKHLEGHEKKRNLGNISPDDLAPAVISQILKALETVVKAHVKRELTHQELKLLVGTKMHVKFSGKYARDWRQWFRDRHRSLTVGASTPKALAFRSDSGSGRDLFAHAFTHADEAAAPTSTESKDEPRTRPNTPEDAPRTRPNTPEDEPRTRPHATEAPKGISVIQGAQSWSDREATERKRIELMARRKHNRIQSRLQKHKAQQKQQELDKKLAQIIKAGQQPTLKMRRSSELSNLIFTTSMASKGPSEGDHDTITTTTSNIQKPQPAADTTTTVEIQRPHTAAARDSDCQEKTRAPQTRQRSKSDTHVRIQERLRSKSHTHVRIQERLRQRQQQETRKLEQKRAASATRSLDYHAARGDFSAAHSRPLRRKSGGRIARAKSTMTTASGFTFVDAKEFILDGFEDDDESADDIDMIMSEFELTDSARQTKAKTSSPSGYSALKLDESNTHRSMRKTSLEGLRAGIDNADHQSSFGAELDELLSDIM